MKYRIIISVGHAPREACYFVQTLAARFQRLCASHGLVLLETIPQDHTTLPQSISLLVEGDAKRLLAAEEGTHALLLRSRGESQRRRKRWYAAVTIIAVEPAIKSPAEALRPEDLEFSAFRCGGPGGQHVNKTSSGVRLHHRPSGIVVKATARRQQQANRRQAMAQIGNMLENQAEQQRQALDKELWHYRLRLERGNPVRVYVQNSMDEALPV
jgi:peptide chain release factor 2/peptide chain release factor